MSKRREAREEELVLVKHLISLGGDNNETFEIPTLVEEYGDVNMGSINFTSPEKAPYKKDHVQVLYKDSDGVPMVISLTINENNELLDMDFWKKDFSPLKTYPTPETVVIFNNNGMI